MIFDQFKQAALGRKNYAVNDVNDTVGAGYVRLNDFRSINGGVLTEKFVVQLLSEGTEWGQVGHPEATAIAGGLAVCVHLFRDVVFDDIFEALVVFGKK